MLDLVADWNDLAGGVWIGASQAEMAVVSWSPRERQMPAAARIEWVIAAVTDDEIGLVATRDPAAPLDTSTTITFVARTRPFPNPALERKLLDSIARRMLDLKGREWAPVR